MSTSYSVHVDIATFKQMFVAQNSNLMRVAGVILAVVGGLGSALLVSMGGLFELPEVTLGLLALFAFGLLFAVHPVMSLSGRKGVVQSWFSRHGEAQASMLPLSALSCDYQVSIEDYGFVETSSSTVNRFPWFVLSGKTAKVPGGVCFLRDKGKDGSAIYNLIGINWAFRNEDVNGVLFVPSDAATPELLQLISSRVRESRATYGGRKGAERAKHDEGLAEWMLGPKTA
ncbi:hypothetical protein [Tractidigestivibacter sp.]|uniref:hypothetical protein n=1 Tax=Tractidigestivibacter sp. TaxID=2847320 RepID=UPI002A91FF17|nr:hypothetical protein [Tractidigestivibacter sp.]MDY5271302.1 hypothetical protein [Tractidigestivibacter sp.]